MCGCIHLVGPQRSLEISARHPGLVCWHRWMRRDALGLLFGSSATVGRWEIHELEIQKLRFHILGVGFKHWAWHGRLRNWWVVWDGILACTCSIAGRVWQNLLFSVSRTYSFQTSSWSSFDRSDGLAAFCIQFLNLLCTHPRFASIRVAGAGATYHIPQTGSLVVYISTRELMMCQLIVILQVLNNQVGVWIKVYPWQP